MIPSDHLTLVPSRKETFLFTDQESEDLEDVKLDIRRRYDIKTSKNDIARVAVAEVIADYKKRGEQSSLVVALLKRAQRQR